MECGNCGVELVAGAAFCPSCGKQVSRVALTAAPSVAAGAGLALKVAAALCYLAGFISGIVFLLLEPYRRDPFVRFHAFQAIFLSAAWILLHFALGGLIALLPWTLWALIVDLSRVVSLAGLIVSLLLMYKAYNRQRFKLPLIGDLADKRV